MTSMAVAARNVNPILSNIKAIAQEDALVIMATDLEVGIRYEIRGVKVSREGTAILPPQKLISILRESSDETVSLDANAEASTIRTSTGKFELLGGNPDEYPDVPTFDSGGRYHEIRAGVLKTLLKRTAFAADKKENARYSVNGVLWEADGKKARLVATDTKRLALTNGEAEVHGEVEEKTHSHMIPLKTIALLERNLTDDGELIRVSLKPNAAVFQLERALIHSNLGSGKFPPYQNIIPKKSAIKLQMPTAEFQARVRQASIMTDDEAKRVDFYFEPGKVTLKARGKETGSSDVVLDLPEYLGPEVKIAFDPQYLLELCRAIEGEPTVTLEMTDGMNSAVFRVGENYLYLVMPMGGA
jgi:DNA polymerase-3 subunit beta